MYGPFNFPQNSRPISPILWLCLLEEDNELKKPFQIILPHFLTGVSDERIHYHKVEYAKASHIDYSFEDNQMRYTFHRCETKTCFVSSGGRNYGILETNHCCFYCLEANQTSELVTDAEYCLVRIESPIRDQVYFSAVYFLETCLRVRLIPAWLLVNCLLLG